MTRASDGASPVAVVGISCRLPGAPDPQSFWRFLEDGQQTVDDVPADRFDQEFFDITPREAVAMDPQEQLLLELAWEALEDAGIVPGSLRETQTAVFLGPIDRHAATSPHGGMVADRVSRTLGLTGPSLTVDSVRSSSLVAVHLAYESLWRGEAELALAGGAHLSMDPEAALGASSANDAAQEEGGGLVVLKPLAAARADGDRVYCVIRGSAADDGEASVGDPESSGGIARLIKTVLLIEHRRVPASLDVEHDERTLVVEGSNCHLVVAEAPTPSPPGDRGVEGRSLPSIPLVLSARNEPALREAATRLGSHLRADPDLNPADVAYSLATTRSRFERRAVVVGQTPEQLLAGLSALARGERAASVARGTGSDSRGPAFLFPGQGGQWLGMADELIESSPAFARHMDDCEQALEPFVDWSLREAIRGAEPGCFDRLDVLQPSLLAVTISLGKLCRELGLEPTMMVGQSQGEIAAAHIAGGLSLDDAARVGALHSKLSLPLVDKGGMLAVSLPPDELLPRLRPFGERVSMAGINGPASLVVSGDSEALAELASSFEADGVRAQPIAVDYAAHSAQLEGVREALLEAFDPISPRSGEIPFHSTVTGELLDTAELGPDYWYRNLRSTVRLEPVVRSLLERGWRTFVEVGPHPVLGFGVQETIEEVLRDEDEAVVLGTLRRGEGGPDRLALSLGEAHAAGAELDWEAYFRSSGAKRVRLPTYPFQRGRHSIETPPESDRGQDEAAAADGEAKPAVLDLVRAEVVAVLGEAVGTVDEDTAFKELGMDSLGAMELRNGLRFATGLSLPTTVVFDHPTAASMAAYLEGLMTGAGNPGAEHVVRAVVSEEPIAIVGMSCRFPAGASSPEDLWRLVAAGADGVSDFPSDRGWDLERLFHPDPDNPGTSYARAGGFLLDAGDFDAEFFGIAPREALATDPQQRLLLEASWEALEAAGIDPSSLRGESTGVFAGISSHDYTAGLRAPEAEVEGYRLTGSLTSVASGRIAYALGLEGPALTVDTACSSSLVAMHLAARALNGGECSFALAGGATVLGSPGMFVEFSRQRGLARDGRCKSFAEGADGTGFAEGVGVVALERLSDAERNGHPVLATIRGSAVNQDGASNGLTAPNGRSQERVIRQALANAGLEPGEVDAVEAHGTGTTLGDPIEAGALLATYGQDREAPLRLGSIKSNIGHAQAAAGVAGVIKMTMAMREGVLPRTLHVDRPTSKVEWEAGEVELLTEQVAWEANGRPRRAGVSSFGISGTNAHLILEEAPPSPESAEDEETVSVPAPTPLHLSAKTEPALREAAARLAAHLRENPELDPTDVAHSLVTTRSAFEHRAVALGESREELLDALAVIAEGGSSANAITARARSGKLACLFSGQGSQRLGMGRELYENHPAFRDAFEEICTELDSHLDVSLQEIVFAKGKKAAAKLDRTTYAQPALFAIEVALFRALESQGLKPDLLAGHSVGEIAAAHVAGVLSLPDACKLIAARGRLMGELPKGGAMLAIEATEQEASEYLRGKEEELSLAAINGPRATVLSGVETAIEAAQTHWQEQGRKTKRLSVSHAFHSPLIEPMLEEFAEVAESLQFQEPQIPIVSNRSGEVLTAAEATDPAYWVSHARSAVRFADSIATLNEQGASAYLELGPDPVLIAMAEGCLEGQDAEPALIPTLREGRPEPLLLAAALAGAHAAGAKLEWDSFFAGANPKRVKLPTYPFQRKRYWLSASSGSGDARSIGQADADHPMLGAAIEDPRGDRLTLTGRLSTQTHPWLADHAVAGTVLLPGTAFVELALRAGREVDAATLAELTLQAPLVFSEAGAAQLQVSVGDPDEAGNREVAVHSRPEGGEEEEGEWTCHAQGILSTETAEPPEPLAAWPPEGAEPLAIDDFYGRLADAGFEYGPAFQGVTAAWRAGDEIFTEVSLAAEQREEAGSFGIHPALLDSALHGIVLSRAEATPVGSVELPFSWSGVSVRALGSAQLRVVARRRDEGVALRISDSAGTAIGEVGLLALRTVDPSRLRGVKQDQDDLLGIEWREVGLAEGSAESEIAETSLWRYEPDPDSADLATAARAATDQALAAIKEWLAAEHPAGSRLALITRGAVAANESEGPDLAAASLWGLARSAQAEHPGSFVLIDTDGSDTSEAALAAALHTEEPQLALREGTALAPRAIPVGDRSESLVPPPGPWRLGSSKRGTLESLALLPDPGAADPLGPTEVRIAMRAAGLNFRDVLIALDLYPGEAEIGSEGAGVVLETGSEVGDLAAGDRVMGLVSEAFAPVALAERAQLTSIPEGWTFERAAAVPIVFLTARYGLVDLAGLKHGERVLVHAGAGGVGMAAIQLARHLGAEVFATASPAKWEALRELGVAEDRIASSRDLDFKERFLEVTGGEGVDVVLNSLAGGFVDASLELLPRGGRFLEMGKTDVREPEHVAAEHAGVSYRAFDLADAGPERTGEMLAEIVGLFESGALRHLPTRGWDVRRAPEAFRHLREGSNVGKVVLTVPQTIAPERTVLVTGATGGLGSLVARHLAAEHGARHLLLTSRSGPEAEGAEELRVELEELGAEARIVACDVSDRGQLEELLDSIPGEHPLGAVIHAAGALADGLVESLTGEQIDRVFAPKADAAWHLHELTAGMDLSAFVMFSSGAGVLGAPGQANYAAANSFLDALAERRHAEGLPATSIAWGLWERESGMTSHLGEADLARMRRTGLGSLSDEQGLALFDRGLAAERPTALALGLSRILRSQVGGGALPVLLADLARVPARRRSTSDSSFAAKLATLPEAERESFVLGFVRAEVATVLGHDSSEAIEPDRSFKALGFDSLAAVELRNRLNTATGLRLPAPVVFNHPTSARLAGFLLGRAAGAGERSAVRAAPASAGEDPIAIVGMSCRYPGGVSSPEELWRLVASGADGISAFPADRGWNLKHLYHPDPDNPGTSYAREGGFLADAASFDSEFFGIAPREARAMDPQQRLLLEACWEALEAAGIDPASLRGEPTGVFAGISSQDYVGGPRASGEDLDGLRLISSATSVASGRVAYSLGLEGPAITVDTACSSSLVAMHLAARGLNSGECSLALAGGATVLATPEIFTEFSRQGALSPDGRCRAFADTADGTGFSEGVGVLVLERLSDAKRNGHPVLAVIRGSAVNQDGASNGLTAPNGPSQERVIRQALANAGLEPAEVDAVEAHGTGTTLGDPIEAGALLATYGQDRETPLRLGSIKSNIGHAQAAAGVAGVIKMTMAMREGVLPRTLHVDEPSSKVEWEAGEIELLTEQLPWEANGRPRRAGVSSFGISGTNAHVILEEAPEPGEGGALPEEPGDAEGEEGTNAPLLRPTLLPLSAKTEPALAEAAARLASHLRENPELDPTDVSHSLATTRTAFEHRAVALGESREELLDSLAVIAEGGEGKAIARGTARSERSPAFLFPGQGAQHPQMALELLDSSPHFASSIEECEEALSPFLDWSLTEVLREEEGQWLNRLDVVQPALFAVMVSLAKLWQRSGVKPAVVIGHSQGEIAAAHIAGGLSLEDAARVIASRAKAMAKIAGKGGMLSVSLPVEELEARLDPYGEHLSLAAINGPASQVVSGEPEALEELLDGCESEGIRAQRIAVDYAAHSSQIEGLKEELLEAFAPISPKSGEIPFHSTLTGEPIDTAELGAEYWYRNLRETVKLEPVLRSLLSQGQRGFLEIGPHPVLGFSVEETIEDALPENETATVLGTLRREEGGPERFALSLAEAHANGMALDWEEFFACTGAKQVPLPTYPFQRRRYWVSASTGGGDARSIGLTAADHPMLGAAIEDPRGEGLTLTGRLSTQTHPWLADHAIVGGTVLLPGTGFVELALKAGQEVGAQSVQELTLQAPLIFPEGAAAQIQVSVGGPDEEGNREVSIHARPESEEEAEWTCHATGVLSSEAPDAPELPDAWPPQGSEPLAVEDLYDRLAEVGFEYGPAFQGLTAAWQRDGEVFAEASLAPEQRDEAGRFCLHPALLDASFHAALELRAEAVEEGRGLVLPFAWRGVRVASPGAASLRVRVPRDGDEFRFAAVDRSGALVASVDTAIARSVEGDQVRAAAQRSRPVYRVEWSRPDPAPANGSAPPTLAILAEEEIGDLGAPRHADLSALLGWIEAGGDPPAVVVADYRHRAAEQDDLLAAVRAGAEGALELLQAWLAVEALQASRLCLLTEGALAAAEGESPDLVTAPLAGLIRSAHSEYPGRFCLVDVDGSEDSLQALAATLGIEEEPQIALRGGVALAPRLARAKAGDGEPAQPIDPDSTVLISGGTSGIGALVARHLATEHGARHLLLASRSGAEARGAGELVRELEELGAEATVAACDVSDREQLEELLGSIPREHPLGAVVHSAAVLDDGVLESLDSERLERVMRPKVDAAWHLHELTAGMELAQFVVFSSAAGILGGTAQANYAAANAFLDALAQHRHSRGLSATSLAWGLWGQESSLANDRDEAGVERMVEQIRARLGFVPMPPKQGLELFDAARASGEPLLAPVAFDSAALRAQASAGALAPVLRGLVRIPVRRERESGSLAQRLAEVPEGEREGLVLGLVRTHAAGVLGHASAEEVEPERAFKEMGLDSLGAVELRNRLAAATGLRLLSTLAFDHPNARSVAELLLSQAQGAERRTAVVPAAAAPTAEPIAILGISCRYPGGARSPEELWQLLASGGDAVTAFPADRGWDLERLYDPDPDRPGTCYVREGGFVYDAPDFDPGFFGVGPREAVAMDPQQRLALEVSWLALEDAGVDPTTLRGSATGVFAGVMYHDYGLGTGSSAELEGYMMAPGSHGAAVSGRVAYALGLEGPAISVDTACSSSLVALHLATQALQRGECAMALAGGVAVFSTPGMFTEFSRQRALATDGRCKAFAEAADGTGLAEGVGMLVLERLSDAERNGHPVLATIKGSAINQDGASNGFTAPNGPSQERVIRQALANAGLEPGDVDAVEAHGTGTTLGDPIEAGALLATYGQDRETPLRLGSVKSNIGHTQAAAGVAGVIKMTMALREGVLPRTLHVDAPSSEVDWAAGKVELLTEQLPWEADGRPRRAGVSSFGASGTNAHLILEQAPELASDESGEDGGGAPAATTSFTGPTPLHLSAKTEPALREAAARLAAHLRENPELDPTDVAHSLVTTRSAFEHRAVALGESREELLDALAVLAEGGSSANAITARARSGKLACLFSGQGSQRLGMGRELYEANPAFRDAFEEICAELDPHLDVSLQEIVFAKGKKAAAKLDRTTYAQPALFAIEVALFRALEAQGLKPGLLAGHSVGEIAAAHVAGVLDLPDACKLIAARGRLMGELPKGGAMLAIEATEQEASEYLRGKEEELSLAAINGPRATVLSGVETAIEAAQAHWQEQGRKTKRLSVSHAFHSPLIEPMLEEFAEVAESLQLQEPQIPIVSNRSGEVLTAAEATDPAYWVSHARSAVRFADSIATLNEQGASAFLELGPDPVLIAMAEGCLEGQDAEPALIPTLREGRPERFSVAAALASAHAAGAKLEWDSFFAGANPRRVKLPTYPFQRKRFWAESALGAGDLSAAGQSSAEHPLLGAAVALAGGDRWLFTGRLSTQTHPWLADHAVAGAVLLPGTAFVELALRAGREVDATTLQELTLQAPMIFSEAGAVQVQVSVGDPDEEGNREVAVHSRAEGGEEEEASEWTCHARGVLAEGPAVAPEPLTSWPPEGAEPLAVDDFYDRLVDAGFEYGPAFQGVTAAWREGEEIYVEVSLAPEQREEAARFGIHPALLDAALHGIGLLADAGHELVLPFSWGEVSFAAEGATELRVRLKAEGEEVSLALADPSGAPVARVGFLLTRPVDPSQLRGKGQMGGLLEIEWREVSLAEGSAERETAETSLWRYEPDADVAESANLASAARAAADQALTAIKDWLAAEHPAGSRLALITEGAVAASEGKSPDPAAASLWGLVRSAQSEHPGRFVLIDSDGSDASEAALAAALAGEEPQLMLREGTALVPRAARLPAPSPDGVEGREAIAPERTVLVTGATGGLGALVARHLVEEHGVRHLLLVSRSGPEAEGATELRAELEELGAEARIAACDVSDRGQLEELLASIPVEYPLGAVIHAAGTVADGLVESLTEEQIDRVFAPKADAAWHLHELTAGMDLSAFVLFSSFSATLGGPGQANYAAANSFLDALAERRRAESLPATSIAWGLWQRESGMTARLDEADLARMGRLGLAALSDEQGLALFEEALAVERPLALAPRLEPSALRSLARRDALPLLLSGLVRAPARRASSGSLVAKLAGLPEAEREGFVLELVRGEVAAVLGHGSAAGVDPDRAFKEMGFDSLAAVELRNRLGTATGLALAATAVFDYPAARPLATHLLSTISPEEALGAGLESQEGEIRDALASIPLSRLRSAGLIDPLMRLARGADEPAAETADESESIDAMDVSELIRKSVEGVPTESGAGSAR